MMRTKRVTQSGFIGLLQGNGGEIRRVDRGGRTLYAAIDVVAALSNPDVAPEMWELMKQDEPVLTGLVEMAVFPDDQQMLPGQEDAAATDAVDLEGVMRVVQSVPTAKAERIRRWLATNARERLEESENPELAILRTRRLYEQRGYSRRWVDKRLRGVSARHELTAEWYKRGATESDQYRALTNAIVRGGFGMEVEGFRAYKNLFKTGENLRDHMTDLELALTALGETMAVELHRQRDSRSFEQLERDAEEAGQIVSKLRGEIETRTGRPVVQPANHRGWWAGTRRRAAAATRPAGVPVGGRPGTDVEGAGNPHPAETMSPPPGHDVDGAAVDSAAPEHAGVEADPAGKAVA